jgi:hypothetical protein
MVLFTVNRVLRSYSSKLFIHFLLIEGNILYMYILDFLVEICTIDLQYACFTDVDYLLANDFAYEEAKNHPQI